MNNIVEALPKNRPQCYETAHAVFKQMGQNDGSVFADLAELKLRPNSVSVVDIYVGMKTDDTDFSEMRAKYGIKNTFWLPRLFLHSFNIIANDTHVEVWQSWFKLSNYHRVVVILNHEFPTWLQRLNSALCNYKANPVNLFKMFKFVRMLKGRRNVDLENLFKLIKKEAFDLEIRTSVRTANTSLTFSKGNTSLTFSKGNTSRR